jgi:UPF0042 nucleotide-binding protein
MKLVIISGLSGSGKTVALHTLEDQEYYCIDNLHIGLLREFVNQLVTSGHKFYSKAAIGIDARSGSRELENFPRLMNEIKATGLEVEIIFLQADTDTLIKRYSETRRRHPLTHKGLPLVKAIHLERSMLSVISAHADLKLDTTHTNVHQLRTLIKARVSQETHASLSLLFQSFGFKHGVPADSDYVFDVRCLPNPYWVPELRGLTGRDEDVIEYLQKYEIVDAMYHSIRDFLEKWISHFQAENRSYLSVSIGCTGGQHRSVYLAERLTEYFRKALDIGVSLRHRELEY